MSRGAIKYQPFKALEGHDEALRDREMKRTLVDRPSLSQDDFERLNDILIRVINEGKVATFFVFRKGSIIEIKSNVNKVMNGYLYLEEDRVLITDITNIII